MNSMKPSCLLLITFAIFIASCATTTVTDVWKDKAYKGKAQKIVVIMVAKLPDMRNLFEDRFAGELQGRGNDAIQSYNIIPMEQLREKELVKSKIRSSGADTVLLSRLVDTKTIESYTPGIINAIPNSYYEWGGYYDVVLAEADYGHTGNVEVAYLETNVYDVKTGKLIWSSHSKTNRTEGEQQLINTFIQIMIKKLASSGIIQ